MAGKKYGAIIAVKVPGTYFALPAAEQAKPGAVMESLMQKYAGRVDLLRRLWTSAFTAEVTDVFLFEADDPMDAHLLTQELNAAMGALGGDPDRFGVTAHIWVGVNPDA